MNITEFLEARIAEDEAAARAAAVSTGGAGWSAQQLDHEGLSVYGDVAAGQIDFDSEEAVPTLRHLVRFDPARVLAECAAKRAIIELHEDWPVLIEQEPEFGPLDITDGSYFAYSMSRKIAWLTEREYVKRFGSEPPTTPMIRAMAAVYSDHPDYQEDWA